MPPKELSEAVIGVSQAYQGTARLELLSPLAEFRWENAYTEPCMVLHLASEGDIVITASSVDFILISPHAICVKLLQPTSSRVTEHMRGDWQNNLNARNQAIILYLLPFDESKYLRFTNGNQVMYGNMESLRQLFEIKWAPYRGKEGFNQDNLGYIHARVDFRAQPFAEVISSRMFDFAFSDLVFPNNNHICQQIEKLSIVPQAKDESAIVVEDIIDILPMDTPASNGVNRKRYSPNENRKQTNGQLANDDNEPVEGEILVKYPSGKNGVDVHLRDMCRLPYNEMLNDTNIELGIKHILETNEEFSQSCHAFNTYFFGKLTQDGHRVNYRSPRARQQWIQGNYQNLKRWTRKVDVFEKEHLVVPINTELHWCVMIIKNPKALLSAKGEANTSKEPCLYIMLDSIPDSDEIRALGPEIMLDYLELEFQDKKKKNTNLVFCRGNMKKVVHKHNPVQKNFVDCGIYTLGFLENYATKPPSYKQKYEIDWTEYSPFFEITTVRYYREKLIKLIKNRAGEARWSRLEQFERTLGGVTNPSLESRVEAARKPRAHSFCLADWRQHENKVTKLRTKKKRAHSLPASSSTLISCKPIVIVRGENGVIKCPGI